VVAGGASVVVVLGTLVSTMTGIDLADLADHAHLDLPVIHDAMEPG
jgi:hypothetical protein